MLFHDTVMGLMERVRNAMRKVDVRRRDQNLFGLFLDRHDPIQGMLLVLELLVVPGEREDFILMRAKIAARERKLARGIFVADPMAGLAQVSLRPFGLDLGPLPTTVLVKGAALRTEARVMALLPGLVGIMNALVDHLIAPALSGQVALFHTCLTWLGMGLPQRSDVRER